MKNLVKYSLLDADFFFLLTKFFSFLPEIRQNIYKRVTFIIFFLTRICEMTLSSSRLFGTESLTWISYVPVRSLSETLKFLMDALNEFTVSKISFTTEDSWAADIFRVT